MAYALCVITHSDVQSQSFIRYWRSLQRFVETRQFKLTAAKFPGVSLNKHVLSHQVHVTWNYFP